MSLNATVINSLYIQRNVKWFEMHPLLAFTLTMHRFQNASFSHLSVFISVFEKHHFYSGAVWMQEKTNKFCSVFIWKQSSVRPNCFTTTWCCHNHAAMLSIQNNIFAQTSMRMGFIVQSLNRILQCDKRCSLKSRHFVSKYTKAKHTFLHYLNNSSPSVQIF